MALKLLNKKPVGNFTMQPDEGYSHGKGLMRIEPFLFIPEGFNSKERTYFAAFEVEILNEIRVFIDDEEFTDYSPAGKKAHRLVADFVEKFRVLVDLVIIPNVEAVEDENDV